MKNYCSLLRIKRRRRCRWSVSGGTLSFIRFRHRSYHRFCWQLLDTTPSSIIFSSTRNRLLLFIHIIVLVSPWRLEPPLSGDATTLPNIDFPFWTFSNLFISRGMWVSHHTQNFVWLWLRFGNSSVQHFPWGIVPEDEESCVLLLNSRISNRTQQTKSHTNLTLCFVFVKRNQCAFM